MDMRRIIVTGASGFIGDALVRHLARLSHEVVAISRRPAANICGIRTALVGRYGDAAAIRQLAGAGDCVVHLAAPAHRRAADPAEQAASVADTAMFAQACADAGVARFILLSSIGVNGNSSAGTPFTETAPPAPVEPYALAKSQAEDAVRSVAALSAGMELVVLRPPLVYGNGAPGNFARIAAAVRRGIPLPLMAFRNLRSFIALGNLLHVIELCCRHQAAGNELLLVADGEDVSLADFVLRMASAMDRPARLFALPTPLLRAGARAAGFSAEVDRLAATLQVDSSKARRILDWVPPFTLDEGLRAAFQPERRHT